MTDPRLTRIAEIEKNLTEATSWGSWMVMAANERERLVNDLRREGHQIEHKFQARTGSGARVS